MVAAEIEIIDKVISSLSDYRGWISAALRVRPVDSTPKAEGLVILHAIYDR